VNVDNKLSNFNLAEPRVFLKRDLNCDAEEDETDPSQASESEPPRKAIKIEQQENFREESPKVTAPVELEHGRKPMSTAPLTENNETHWMKRHKNNEPAQKSKRKRRENYLAMKIKIKTLVQENNRLKWEKLNVEAQLRQYIPTMIYQPPPQLQHPYQFQHTPPVPVQQLHQPIYNRFPLPPPPPIMQQHFTYNCQGQQHLPVNMPSANRC
jgi:hypothetical protein